MGKINFEQFWSVKKRGLELAGKGLKMGMQAGMFALGVAALPVVGAVKGAVAAGKFLKKDFDQTLEDGKKVYEYGKEKAGQLGAAAKREYDLTVKGFKEIGRDIKDEYDLVAGAAKQAGQVLATGIKSTVEDLSALKDGAINLAAKGVDLAEKGVGEAKKIGGKVMKGVNAVADKIEYAAIHGVDDALGLAKRSGQKMAKALGETSDKYLAKGANALSRGLSKVSAVSRLAAQKVKRPEPEMG